MRRFFRSAAFPILIVIVLAFFAQKLISGPSDTQTPTFNEFVNQIKHNAELDRRRSRSSRRRTTSRSSQKNGQSYTTGYPNNTEPSSCRS